MLTKEENACFYHKNYAHRGLYTKDQTVPENSLTAFRLAKEAGYGYELDIQLSKDGQVVVFHDDTLDRVTGIHGRVEDFTLEELRAFPLSGTKERIPLFTEVLSLINGEGGPLIVELKSGKRNEELCIKGLDILKNYKGVYCIESFNPLMVRWFRKNAPGVVRGQLSASYALTEKSLHHPLVAFLLSRCFFNFLSRPDFIAYETGKRPARILRLQKKGVLLIGWTGHDASAEKDNDAVIFEFHRPETVY